VNLERVDQIAKAVLYEGYMLYPYRPSSVKNRQRFNFGVLYPQAHNEAQGGVEACSMKIELLVCRSSMHGNSVQGISGHGDVDATLEVRLRFLHLQTRHATEFSNSSLPEGWQEAVEREVVVSARQMEMLIDEPLRHAFKFSEADGDAPVTGAKQEAVQGCVEVSAEKIGQDVFNDDVFKVRIVIRNTTPLANSVCSRDEALMHSFVSTHVILGVENAEFASLFEPPEELQELASQCQNVGLWPVLVGDPGRRDTMLASPIILYDYPQIAPESAGDLFDGTEIDEILSLRIMTLTDEEKREIRQSDERARQILERTENMPAEQFMKLHGAVRGLRPVSAHPLVHANLLKEDAS
jgi:hypothetical protein